MRFVIHCLLVSPRPPLRCGIPGCTEAGDSLHAALLTTRTRKDRVELLSSVPPLPRAAASDMVERLVKQGKRRLAREVLELGFLHAVPRASAYATLAAACTRAGELTEAGEVLAAMHALQVRCSQTVHASLARELAGARDPIGALALLRDLEAPRIRPRWGKASLAGALVPDAASSSEEEQLWLVGSSPLESRGVVAANRTLSTVLTALLKSGARLEAGELARELSERGGVEYDEPLYNVMLAALLKSGQQEGARALLGTMRDAGLGPSEYTMNVLLADFVERRQMPEALEVFYALCDGTPGATPPGIISFNILIDGFARAGERLNAESLLVQMESAGVSADSYTFHALLRACIGAESSRASPGAGAPLRALAYFRLMRRAGVRPDARTFTLLSRALRPSGRAARAVSMLRAAFAEADARRASRREEVLSRRRLREASEKLRSEKASDDERPSHRTPSHRTPSHPTPSHEPPSSPTPKRPPAPARGWRRPLLDTPACIQLLRGCADASAPTRALACEEALWLWAKMDELALGGADGSESKELCRALLIRNLGNARNLDGARRVFDAAPMPRTADVWEAMLAVQAQLRLDPQLSANITGVALTQLVQQGGGVSVAPGYSLIPPENATDTQDTEDAS